MLISPSGRRRFGLLHLVRRAVGSLKWPRLQTGVRDQQLDEFGILQKEMSGFGKTNCRQMKLDFTFVGFLQEIQRCLDFVMGGSCTVDNPIGFHEYVQHSEKTPCLSGASSAHCAVFQNRYDMGFQSIFQISGQPLYLTAVGQMFKPILHVAFE